MSGFFIVLSPPIAFKKLDTVIGSNTLFFVAGFLLKMNTPIFFLTFVSAATELCTDEELVRLLDTCRRNNSKRGITGLLLYHEGSFIEIIEGPQNTIEWLFINKILHDKRHHQVIKLISGIAPHRSFPDWSMGFERVDRKCMDERLPNFNTILESHSNPEVTFSDIYAPLLVFLQSFYRSSGYSTKS